MNLRVTIRSLFCLLILGFHPISAQTQNVSETHFETLLMASEGALNSGEWTQAINFGESALNACRAQLSETATPCINIMKNNTLAYQQAGGIIAHADAIERAYRIALSQLGPMHDATIKTRQVFYQLIVEQKRYSESIPVVIALIHHERKTSNDEHKILDRFLELHTLYLKTGQAQYEEPTLESIVTLTKKLLGVKATDFQQAIVALANCYCRQKNYDKLDTLTNNYALDISCN